MAGWIEKLGVAAWLSSCAACGGAGGPSELPDFDPTGQAKCKIAASQTKPLIVEWPLGERTDLETQVRQNKVVVVRYDGCEMQLLSRCAAPGGYAYTPVSPKSNTVRISDADELYATIPVGAAKLESTLSSSGELAVDMTMVGTYVADRASWTADEIEGQCKGASHVIVGLNVGAFEFYAGASAEIGAGAQVFDAGAGVKARSVRENIASDGVQEACLEASLSDDKPPERCGALLKISVEPIGNNPNRTAKGWGAACDATPECRSGLTCYHGVCEVPDP